MDEIFHFKCDKSSSLYRILMVLKNRKTIDGTINWFSDNLILFSKNKYLNDQVYIDCAESILDLSDEGDLVRHKYILKRMYQTENFREDVLNVLRIKTAYEENEYLTNISTKTPASAKELVFLLNIIKELENETFLSEVTMGKIREYDKFFSLDRCRDKQKNIFL